MSLFSGVITALVTPFYKGEVDYTSLKNLVEFQLQRGINKFVVNGTTAESPTLEEGEVEKIYSVVRSTAGESAVIILGTGSNSTKKTVFSTKKAESLGAQGALVVTPYYNKPPQRGLVEHFSEVANNVNIPVILYNVPGRTITSLSLETIQKLSQVENIVGIKEATGDLQFGEQVFKETSSDFLITSGDDVTCVELAFVGGQGVISVISHLIPEELIDKMGRAMKGDRTSLADYKKFSRLNDLLFCETNPIPVKAALKQMGVIASDEMRLPLISLREDLVAELKSELKNLEKL